MDSPATSHFNGTTDTPSRTVSLALTRTPLAKAFVATIYFVNWLLTGMVLFTTVGVFRLNKKRMPDTLLALPITVILIVPSLRALMVGSPAFGMFSCWFAANIPTESILLFAIGILLGGAFFNIFENNSDIITS